MEWMAIVVAVLFALLGLGCLVLVVVGLPGTWLLLGLAAGIEVMDGRYLAPGADVTFGWWVIGVAVVLAAVGEALEAAAGLVGARAGGGTRRGMVGALIGGIAGALFFTPALPIPLVGTLVGALIGTFVGALVAELTAEDTKGVRQNFSAALSATVGRFFGTLGKTVIAAVVWVVLVTAAFVP